MGINLTGYEDLHSVFDRAVAAEDRALDPVHRSKTWMVRQAIKYINDEGTFRAELLGTRDDEWGNFIIDLKWARRLMPLAVIAIPAGEVNGDTLNNSTYDLKTDLARRIVEQAGREHAIAERDKKYVADTVFRPVIPVRD